MELELVELQSRPRVGSMDIALPVYYSNAVSIVGKMSGGFATLVITLLQCCVGLCNGVYVSKTKFRSARTRKKMKKTRNVRNFVFLLR